MSKNERTSATVAKAASAVLNHMISVKRRLNINGEEHVVIPNKIWKAVERAAASALTQAPDRAKPRVNRNDYASTTKTKKRSP